MLICSGSMFSILESQTGARCWTSEMLKGVCQKGCTFVMFKRGINFPHHCITAWGCLSLGFLKFVLFLLLLLFFSISILQCCKLLQSEDQDDLNPKSAGRARCRKPTASAWEGPTWKIIMHFNRVESQVLIFGCNAKIDASWALCSSREAQPRNSGNPSLRCTSPPGVAPKKCSPVGRRCRLQRPSAQSARVAVVKGKASPLPSDSADEQRPFTLW